MLKVQFWLFANVILMKVLQQGDEIGRWYFKFTASNGIKIHSNTFPQIKEDTLYLQGVDLSQDNIIVSLDFLSKKEAKKNLEKYIKAIEEYNDSLFLENQREKNKEGMETFIVG